MTDFDPIKAAQEEISGLVDVHRVILSRARHAERVAGEAEAEAAALKKTEGFMSVLLENARLKLKALTEARDAAAEDAAHTSETTAAES